MKLTALTLAASVLAAGGVKATLTAPTHTPKVNTKWYYTVRVSNGGKPAAARLTAQIIDPIGGVNPVAYDGTKKPIKNFPFKGTFRDYVIWPADARGYPLTLRLTVKAATTTKVLKYRVTPR
jgi:hypothetical protein